MKKYSMEWLKSLAGSMWSVVEVLVALVLFAVIGVPLGIWFWAWIMESGHAVGLIALAIIAGAGHYFHHNAAA